MHIKEGYFLLYLQKLIASFIELPGLFITIFFILALIFLIKKQKKLFFLFLIFACGFYFIATDLSIKLLVLPYEYQFSEIELQNIQGEPTAIVVFSGGMMQGIESGGEIYDQIGPHSMMRLYRAFQVYKKTGSEIIIAGGNVYDQKGTAISKAMGTVLESWGVPPKMIKIEEKSKTTWENAVYSLELMEQTVKNIILVTSALHMPRSYQTFQRVIEEKDRMDINLIPYPGDYRAENTPVSFASFLPNNGSLDTFSAAFHEWLGNIFYLLK
ncbi:MAG: YdcF family protein [Candidatus Moranbacteria bacterium]|nr:YdcF family protein [Candidatus Moranbacteria bacterium]